MSDPGAARFILEHLVERVLPVFDQAILRIPDDQLDFRASPANMSAAELGYHVYELLYVLFRAVEQGRLYTDVLREMPFDPDDIRSGEDIVAYGRRVRAYLRDRMTGLTVAQLDARIAGGGAMNDTGMSCVRLMLEEAIHHRGQLQIYLRLLGVAPPNLFAWPERDAS